MIRFSKVLLSVLFVSFFVSFAADAFPRFMDSQKRQARVWPRVIFYQAGDFNQFEITMQQNRDQVRKMLMTEFADVAIPLAAGNPDAANIASVVADILRDFDNYHQHHKNLEHPGNATAFEHLFKAALDQRYTDFFQRSEGGLRKITFYSPVQGLNIRSQKLSSEDSKTAIQHNLDLLNGVDYVMYGTYTILSGRRLKSTITLENILTGKQYSFSATGSVEDISERLAKKVFDHFQKNTYPGWQNPQPLKLWISAPPSQKVMQELGARAYCQGQGARFPYAKELIQAAQGSDYRNGGIKHLEANAPYFVEDKLDGSRNVKRQYYYFHQHKSNQSLGAVRVDSTNRLAHVWCIKGAPMLWQKMVNDIQRMAYNVSFSISDVYREIARLEKFSSRASDKDKIRDLEKEKIKFVESKIGIRYLLALLDAFEGGISECGYGSDARLRGTYSYLEGRGCINAFRDYKAAIAFLDERGVYIDAGAYRSVLP